MRKIFLLLLFFWFASPVNSQECNLTSENNSDVVITIDKFGFATVDGKLKYKNEPKYLLGFNRRMGYGGQMYSLRSLEGEQIDSGIFVGFVGNQVARGTPVKERQSGQRRGLLTDLGRMIYYHLEVDTRFNPSESDSAFLDVANGFFTLDDGCKFFPYMSWADE